MKVARNRVPRTIPRAVRQRKTEFRLALRQARMTAAEWAASVKVTPSHLSHTLNGRESKTLETKIAAFIEQQLRNVA